MFSPSRSGPLHPQKETSQQMASPKPHDISFGASPGRAQNAGAGVGLGARCELGFKFARERPVGGDLQHRAGRGERGVRRSDRSRCRMACGDRHQSVASLGNAGEVTLRPSQRPEM